MQPENRAFTETITYRSFDIGERIVDTATGEVSVVANFHHPLHAGDSPLLFLVGNPWGRSPENFLPAPEENDE